MKASNPPPPAWRGLCSRCRRARATCYCAQIRPFEAGPLFVLLIHPKEARNVVGTARMTRLCIPDVIMIEGKGPDFDRDPRLAALLADPSLNPMLLFPAPDAPCLTHLQQGPDTERALRPDGRRLCVVVIDGTWTQARKMIRDSRVLLAMPRLALALERESEYRIRRQPQKLCISTLEAVHTVINEAARLGIHEPPESRGHDNLLEVFRWMVELQLRLQRERTEASRRP